jgi:hypothetical protein
MPLQIQVRPTIPRLHAPLHIHTNAHLTQKDRSYIAVLTDEEKATVIGCLRRAIGWFNTKGIA